MLRFDPHITQDAEGGGGTIETTCLFVLLASGAFVAFQVLQGSSIQACSSATYDASQKSRLEISHLCHIQMRFLPRSQKMARYVSRFSLTAQYILAELQGVDFDFTSFVLRFR